MNCFCGSNKFKDEPLLAHYYKTIGLIQADEFIIRCCKCKEIYPSGVKEMPAEIVTITFYVTNPNPENQQPFILGTNTEEKLKSSSK